MRYDLTRLAEIVRGRKNKFIRLASVEIIGILLSITAAVISPETFLVAAIIGAAILIFAIYSLTRKYRPEILFSPDLVGINLREHESGLGRDASTPIFHRRNMPHTYANRKAPPRKIRGTVYIRLDNGDIRSIGGLTEAQMKIYEEGDLLTKPQGAAYPMVMDRRVAAQPCPLCGEINTAENSACRACGLPIIQNNTDKME